MSDVVRVQLQEADVRLDAAAHLLAAVALHNVEATPAIASATLELTDAGLERLRRARTELGAVPC